MLRIRLRRVGAKGRPSYRIVVADSRSPRDGRFIEVLGFYDPLTQPATITVKDDRLQYWQSVGAQCSEVVTQVLQSRQRQQASGAAAGQA
jgi:small subunit ribosomal protein S16